MMVKLESFSPALSDPLGDLHLLSSCLRRRGGVFVDVDCLLMLIRTAPALATLKMVTPGEIQVCQKVVDPSQGSKREHFSI